MKLHRCYAQSRGHRTCLKVPLVKSPTGHRFENNSVCLTPNSHLLQKNWTLTSIRSVMELVRVFRCTLCPTAYALLLCTSMRSQTLEPELSPHSHPSNMKISGSKGNSYETKGLYSGDDTEISSCSGLWSIPEGKKHTFCPEPVHTHALTNHLVFSQWQMFLLIPAVLQLDLGHTALKKPPFPKITLFKKNKNRVLS